MTAVDTTATLRERAAVAVHAIAGRLSDPEHVVAVTRASAQANAEAGGKRMELWQPLGLGDGHPGVALLFGELGRDEREYRERTYAYLSTAMSTAGQPGTRLPYHGLYMGAPAVAMAAHHAGTGTGDFAHLSGRLDTIVADHATAVAGEGMARLRAGRPVGSWRVFDVISGTSGLGRLLLDRHSRTGDERVTAALRELLELLAAIATAPDAPPEDGAGPAVPAWWSTEPMLVWPDETGHVNLGFAHGVGGPLALLAMAWRAGVRVARHAEAIERITELLAGWRADDSYGPYWPFAVTVRPDGTWARDPQARVRDAWCYGVLGIARALQLAGDALDRAEWTRLGLAAARGAVDAMDRGGVGDFSLCHGWAGILRIVHRMAADSGDPALTAAVDPLAERLLAGFDPEAPFGYRYTAVTFPLGGDRPGYLEGAAGIALALRAVATGEHPAADAGLLIA